MYRTIWLIAAALACAAHARAQTPPAPPPADAGRGLIVMAPGCSFQFHHGRIRAGDNIPASMSLRNTGQWCLGSLGMSDSSTNGARIVDQPSHGELRMRILPNGIVFIYRPRAGYEGSDRFRITVPSGFGLEYNLATSVTVDP